MKRKEHPIKRSLQILALLSAVNWIAHFLYFANLGLYEDDYVYVAFPLGWSTNDLWQALVSNLTYWPQGRPLGFSIPYTINFFGYGLGGLPAIYIFGAIIVTLNAFLFYLVLKSIGSEMIAVLGALAFCLFPADTTRSYLMHLTGLQPSLTFFLIATLLYASGRTRLSYVVIVGALLTYESGFIVFFGVPLLKRPWDREWIKSFLKHAAVLSAIMITDFVLRGFLGDSRVSMGYRAILIPPKIIGGMVIGPVVSMAQFLLAPIRTMASLDPVTITAAILCPAVFAAVLASLKPGIKDRTLASPAPVASVSEPVRNFLKKPKFLATFETAPRSTGGAENWLATIRPKLMAKGLNQDVAEFCAETARYPIIGSVWLAVSYGLSFTHFPPTVQYGRLTSVHLAAAFGASILVAWMCSVLLFAARVYNVRRITVAGLALYLSLLVGYGIAIQKDFQLSWQYQRLFWTRVVESAPDLNDETVIFVLRDSLPETEYIVTHSWADPIILNQIFQFPRHWRQAPRLFVIDGNWNKMVQVNSDRFIWSVPEATWPPHQEDLPSGNVILLKATEGGLMREYGNIDIQDKRISLKPAAPAAGPQFEKGPLYALLIDESKLGSR